MINGSLFKVEVICTSLFVLWFFLDLDVLWVFVPFLIMGLIRFAAVVVWIITKSIDLVDKYGLFRKKKIEVKEYWEFKD